jgi:hypothetical protein
MPITGSTQIALCPMKTGYVRLLVRPEEYKTRRFGNYICFRPQVKGEEDTYSVGPLRRS